MGNVLEQYRPAIEASVHAYANSGIPIPLLRNQAEMLVVNAEKTWEPPKGPLSNYIKVNLKGMNRIVNDASTIYIPEARSVKYNKFLTIRDEMERQLKRPPTSGEIADKMKMSIGDINRLAQETKRKLVTNLEIGDTFGIEYDPSFKASSLLEFVYNKLDNSNERLILEYLFGLHGKPILATNKLLADKLDISQTSVRNFKDNIIKIIKEYQ